MAQLAMLAEGSRLGSAAPQPGRGVKLLLLPPGSAGAQRLGTASDPHNGSSIIRQQGGQVILKGAGDALFLGPRLHSPPPHPLDPEQLLV